MTNVERMLPLYQGMMTSFYDHRAADVVRSDAAKTRQNQPRYVTDDEKADVGRLAQPQYWVRESLVPDDLPEWLIAFSDITSPTNERTMVPVAIPRVGVGNKLPLVLPSEWAELAHCLLACLSSFALDFVTRQKIGGTTLNYFYVRQLPAIAPERFNSPAPWATDSSLCEWIAGRTDELVATAMDMIDFATNNAAPFKWATSRRPFLKAELDAAMFHLYGIERDDVDYIMETFPIVKRKDLAAHGEYRTKRLILEIYDQMAEAISGGSPYVSAFDGGD